MSYMLTSCEKQIAHEWEKYKGFTVRPLPSTIEYYTHIIHSCSHHKNYLIYGSTPEIRTIFQTFNLPVHLVDRSAEMVRAMGLLTKEKIPLSVNEKFLHDDWLNLSSIGKTFDLLIGDDAINMVNWNQFDLFLSNASNLLNENGLFICHLLIKPDDDLIHQTFEQVISEFNTGKINTSYDLASRLNFICFDEKNYSMGWQQTIEKIGNVNLSQTIDDFNFIDTFGLCNSQFYCPPQNEFEALVTKYFMIEEIYYPSEHAYCIFEPIYLLKKIRRDIT
ncbi:MAG: class I SAM-dependent methyltransferase [Gammaproteobacteria bacterium]|nr:class I SAM-dependent methyltransferase [Gammaproteobacteria bacterium]